jgi:hypothetical protein
MAIVILSGLLHPTGWAPYHGVFSRGKETLWGQNTAFIPDEYERVNRVENGNDDISGEKLKTVEITFYIRKYSFS